MNALLAAIVVAVRLSTAIAANQQPALSGRVLHADLAVPGATLTATRPFDSAQGRGERTVTTTSDENGLFRLATLEPGAWTIKVEMRGFATVTRDITIPPGEPELVLTLTMRSYAEIVGANAVASAWPKQPDSSEAMAKADTPQIMNGSVVNGAASRFAQPRAIGNNRPRQARLYNGSFTSALGSSAWNAQPYSFGGSTSSPAPDYGDGQFTLTVGFLALAPMSADYHFTVQLVDPAGEVRHEIEMDLDGGARGTSQRAQRSSSQRRRAMSKRSVRLALV